MTAGAVLENPGSLAPVENTRESPSWKGCVCLSHELLWGQEKYSSVWIRPNSSPIPALPFISCFTSGKSLNLSDSLDLLHKDTYAKCHWKDCKADIQCWDTSGDGSEGVSSTLLSFLSPYPPGTAVWITCSDFPSVWKATLPFWFHVHKVAWSHIEKGAFVPSTCLTLNLQL